MKKLGKKPFAARETIEAYSCSACYCVSCSKAGRSYNSDMYDIYGPNIATNT
jgi:putative bacteriocin precursor, CLI_3235 family